MTELQRTVEAIECPRCGAPPGEPCIWKVRRPQGHAHLARVDRALALADGARRQAERNSASPS